MKLTRARATFGLALLACTENQVVPFDTGDSENPSTDGENLRPSAPGVRISPEMPSPEDDLRCQRAQPSVDPEGEQIHYQISWEVDGEPFDNDTDLLDASETEAGETWTCIMVAHDGVNESVPGSDSVWITEQNRAPGPATVQITPGSPGTNHPLHCQILEDSIDPDGDSVTYTYVWSQNGADIEMADAELSNDWTAEGDEWTCTVTPSDGELEGESASDTVSIGAPAYGGDVTGETGVVYDASGCSYCPDEDWYIPEKAFDDTPITGANSWVVPWYGGPEWISVDFGSGNEKTITYYGLMGATFHEGYRARDWELQGSHDEVSWEVLHSVTDADLAYVMYGGEPFTYYGFSNTESYRYYRLYVTENMGGQPYNNELGIVEIEMMENAPAE